MGKVREYDDKIRPATPEKIELASTMLGQGGLVVIPTETVYGLAADALDKYAVARIFEVKGRPQNKALVIFVSDLATAKKLAPFNRLAIRLAGKFWPGALTLVLPRYQGCPLPGIITAGLNSLAIRIPRNPVALALLKTAHRPLAVTSANRSGESNPVTAQEAARTLSDQVDLILDGGRCEIGAESTVLDVRGETPVILRAGAIARKSIEKFLDAPIEILKSRNS